MVQTSATVASSLADEIRPLYPDRDTFPAVTDRSILKLLRAGTLVRCRLFVRHRQEPSSLSRSTKIVSMIALEY